MSEEDTCPNGRPDCDFAEKHELALAGKILRIIESYTKDNETYPCPKCLRNSMIAIAALLHLEAEKIDDSRFGAYIARLRLRGHFRRRRPRADTFRHGGRRPHRQFARQTEVDVAGPIERSEISHPVYRGAPLLARGWVRCFSVFLKEINFRPCGACGRGRFDQCWLCSLEVSQRGRGRRRGERGGRVPDLTEA